MLPAQSLCQPVRDGLEMARPLNSQVHGRESSIKCARGSVRGDSLTQSSTQQGWYGAVLAFLGEGESKDDAEPSMSSRILSTCSSNLPVRIGMLVSIIGAVANVGRVFRLCCCQLQVMLPSLHQPVVPRCSRKFLTKLFCASDTMAFLKRIWAHCA